MCKEIADFNKEVEVVQRRLINGHNRLKALTEVQRERLREDTARLAGEWQVNLRQQDET